MKRGALIAAIAGAALAGPAEAAVGAPTPGGHNFQEPATQVMREIIAFHNFLLPIIIVISVFVLALLLWVIVRYNRRANPTPRFYVAPTASQINVRGGLAWLDNECAHRFGAGKTFLSATDAQRRQVLDDIAWPARAKPELSHGVAFFTRMRDMTASGFYSSKMGIQDLRYMGNVPMAKWDGCPPEVIAKLGV